MRDKDGQMYYIENESKGCIPDRGNEIYLRPLIEKIKKEITEHADKEIQRIKAEITAHADEQNARIDRYAKCLDGFLSSTADKEIQRIKVENDR